MYSLHAPFSDWPALTVEDELAALGRMLLIRRFEEKLALLFAMAAIDETGPLEIGGEAVVAGIAAATCDSDTVVTLGPSHGHLLLSSGGDVSALLRQISGLDGTTAAVPSLASGEGVKQYRVVTADARQANDLAQSAEANGAVLVAGRRDAGGLPAEIEALLDEAAARRLPLVVVMDYATADTSQPVIPVVEKHRWPSVQVDGTDVGSVQHAVTAAIGAARAERGPRLVEATTFRYRGHSDRPPARGDRPREETDPIARSRARIVRKMPTLQSSIKGLERQIRETIVAAAQDLHVCCETGETD